MDVDRVLQHSVIVIALFANRERPLQGFELLAYEQACRTIESVLKDFRDTWETKDETENYTG